MGGKGVAQEVKKWTCLCTSSLDKRDLNLSIRVEVENPTLDNPHSYVKIKDSEKSDDRVSKGSFSGREKESLAASSFRFR